MANTDITHTRTSKHLASQICRLRKGKALRSFQTLDLSALIAPLRLRFSMRFMAYLPRHKISHCAFTTRRTASLTSFFGTFPLSFIGHASNPSSDRVYTSERA